MSRLVVLTVGVTHSGKSTFAQALEGQMPNSLVIDQDNHADFINTHYRALLPKQGPNRIKYAVTQTIVDYAVNQTSYHLILCNSNRHRHARLKLIDYYRNHGFTTVVVYFDLPDAVLQERVAHSQRSTSIFSKSSSFKAVLDRQQAESPDSGVIEPTAEEADHFFVIRNGDDAGDVIRQVAELAAPNFD
ncbi:ATP-binding protein [Paenibacillus sp. PSB04]|uniref:ATP-binding protein n=1 Tax=Paenibacillus sp. PSB04 TaxID=2866810 RepID=UPI0021F1F81B|nr:ATP-binding protein [Paenibacillus sp. PSB04]UYO04664.1 ATP-binding protein [Paenibacillus sp. PSB04]